MKIYNKNNANLILVLLIALTVISCQKKDVEIHILKNPEPDSQQQISETADNPETHKPLIVINPSDTVKIMVRQDGAPGMYLGDDGDVHGFYVDLEKMVMERMNQEYELIPYVDVGPIIQGLKSGLMHSALAAPDLPDYRSFLDLSIPYEILHYVVFVQSDNDAFSGMDRDEILKNLSGKKVGVQTQGHIYQILRDYKEIELIEYPTTTQALEDLAAGNLDAVPDVKRIGEYYSALLGWNIKPVGDPILSHEITTAFSMMLDTSLLNRYNTALKSLIEEGRVAELYNEYFGEMTADLIPDLKPE